jgi:hypothetical protein
MAVLLLILLEVLTLARAIIGQLAGQLAGREIAGFLRQHTAAKVRAMIAPLPKEIQAEWLREFAAMDERPISAALWALRRRKTARKLITDPTPLPSIPVKIVSNGIFIFFAMGVAIVVATVAVIAVIVSLVGAGAVITTGSALSSAIGGTVGSAADSVVSSTVGSIVGSVVGNAAVVYAIVLVYCFTQLLVVSVVPLVLAIPQLRRAGNGHH